MGDNKIRASQITLNAPEGFLLNGKIVPSVDSGNLTVALKTLAGNDPSASDPVYCRIDGEVREITSALSTVAVDGFNFFNAGSSELATKEIDYFVYLYYVNTASSLRIGFSRIPNYRDVSDVPSFATTAEGAVYGNGVNTASGDTMVIIGRFAATLSAGAGYTWSVPTFTASNLIQRPIYETRWLDWTAIYTTISSMAFASTSELESKYKIVNDRMELFFRTKGTTSGTASNEIRISTPFDAVSYTPLVGNTGAIGIQTAVSTSFSRPGDNGISHRRLDGSVYTLAADWIISFRGSHQI